MSEGCQRHSARGEASQAVPSSDIAPCLSAGLILMPPTSSPIANLTCDLAIATPHRPRFSASGRLGLTSCAADGVHQRDTVLAKRPGQLYPRF